MAGGVGGAGTGIGVGVPPCPTVVTLALGNLRRRHDRLRPADGRRQGEGIGEERLIAARERSLQRAGEFADVDRHLLLELIAMLGHPRLAPHIGLLGDNAAVTLNVVLQVVEIVGQGHHRWVFADAGFLAGALARTIADPAGQTVKAAGRQEQPAPAQSASRQFADSGTTRGFRHFPTPTLSNGLRREAV